MKISILCRIGSFCLFSFSLTVGQRQMEGIDRGAICFRDGGANIISWRMLGTEAYSDAFNLYLNGEKINSEPIENATMFRHNGASQNSIYSIEKITEEMAVMVAEDVECQESNFIRIPLKTLNGNVPNDASIGDLDGDGQFELVLKQEMNPQDNSNGGYTGETKLEAYEFDGTLMWRINMGKNIREGAHYTQFIVYDFDGDGKAELAAKTADGTIDGKGTVIGNAQADHRNSDGYIMKGPEFLTMFDGETGEALSTVDYIVPRGDVCEWGDPNCTVYANRVDRFLGGVAYLNGEKPSLIMSRGYYTRTVIAAWDFDNKELKSRWVFDTKQNGRRNYEGQGNHQISIADVDEDGKDEIVFGAMVVDDNGEGLYSTGLGHGDALHVSDLVPGRPGLEVFDIQERVDNEGAHLRDARTGELLFTLPSSSSSNEGPGRAMAADVDARYPGAEYWVSGGGISGMFNANGERIGNTPQSVNFAIWWDGDLSRELLNSNVVQKVGVNDPIFTANGCTSNNGTKSTPALSADLFGDWREEIILKCGNNELRVFLSPYETQYKFPTLLHDPLYRIGIAWQNVAYNQPPHTSFFLGNDMEYPIPNPDIYLTDVKTQKRVYAHKKSQLLVWSNEEGIIRIPAAFSGYTSFAVYNIKGKMLGVYSANPGKVTLNYPDFGKNQLHILKKIY